MTRPVRLGDIVGWTEGKGRIIVGLIGWCPNVGFADEFPDDKKPSIEDADAHLGIVPVDGPPRLRYLFTVTPEGLPDPHGDILVTSERASELRQVLQERLTDPDLRKTFKSHVFRPTNLPPSKGAGHAEPRDIPIKTMEGLTSNPTKQMWARVMFSIGEGKRLERVLKLLGQRQEQVYRRCVLEGIPHRQFIQEVFKTEGVRLTESAVSHTRKRAEAKVFRLMGVTFEEVYGAA